MTDKAQFVMILSNSDTTFEVKQYMVIVTTSSNGDKTTFHFNSDGKLDRVTCNC